MNLHFKNGSLVGSGLIDVTAHTASGSYVEFQSTINTTNFTGTFSVHDGGVLKLAAISTNNASFSLDLEGTGQYYNNANVAFWSMTTNSMPVLPGSYTSSSLGITNVLNNGGTITVLH